MTIQFLFPDLDGPNNSGLWQDNSGGHSNLYLTVDEGVSTADDSDFIKFNTSSSENSGVELNLLIDDITIVPSSFTFRYRASGVTGFIYEISPRIEDSAANVMSNFSTIEVSGQSQFVNYESTSTYLDVGDILDSRLIMDHVTIDPTGNLNTLAISAVEVETTGTLGYNSTTMSFFLKGIPTTPANDNIPLYIYGPISIGPSSIFTTTDLFVGGRTPIDSGNMILYTKGHQPPIASVGMMNLFVKSIGNDDGSISFNDNITLFVQNDNVVDSGFFPLFLQGLTGNSGNIPISGMMNLFINRAFDSAADNFTMFIPGPSGFDGGLDLFMHADQNDRSGISLFINGISEVISDNITLYEHGF